MVGGWVGRGDGAGGGDARDGARSDGDVRACECGKVVYSWGWAAAADAGRGDEKSFEGGAGLESGFHLRGKVGAERGLGGVGGEKAGEGAVDASLVGFTEGEKGGGIVFEGRSFGRSVVALWAGAEGAKGPCCLAYEAGEVADYWLNGFEDLLA